MYGEFANLGGLGIMLSGFIAAYSAVVGIVGVFMLVATCFLYKKAGENWWAPIIPIYNVIVYLRMGDKDWWWIFLLCIPIVNIVLSIIVMVDIVKNFGKPSAHVLLWLFFPLIYVPYLAFSNNVKFKESDQVDAAA